MMPRAGAFRHHGVWAMGVKLFQDMLFLSKAWVITGIFVFIVAQLLFIFIRSSNQDIYTAKRELIGVSYVRELSKLLELSQNIRQIAFAGTVSQDKDLAAQVDEAETLLLKLKTFKGHEQIALDEPLQYALNALLPLKKKVDDKEEFFSRADEFVQQLLRLTAEIVDASSLSLEPDQAGYHLMLASTQETLNIRRMLGRLRDLGAQAVKNGALTDLSRRVLNGDSYVMYAQLELLFTRYERIVKAKPELDVLAFEDAFKPVQAFMRTLRKGPLAEGKPVGDESAFAASGKEAIASMFNLTNRSIDGLETLIEARITTLERNRNFQIGFALFGILVAAYFFYCFYLVTRGGMQEVMRHVKAMAHGDLSTSVQIWGKDEAALLLHSINAMQTSMRELIGEVLDCSAIVVATSSEVCVGAEDLSLRTANAAGRLQETAAAIEEISNAVKHTALRAGESASLGQENAIAAKKGSHVIEQVVTTMGNIQTSSRKIAEIISFVNTIAFQTNILALNAAVEAAHAGEQGKGFSIVANEVRELARRCAGAAHEIKGLIHTSTDQSEQGGKIVGSAGDAMSSLMRNAHTMSTLLAEVSSAATEQNLGAAKVSEAINRLESDTQRNNALVEETTAAALSMQQSAQKLANIASKFVLHAEGR